MNQHLGSNQALPKLYNTKDIILSSSWSKVDFIDQICCKGSLLNQGVVLFAKSFCHHEKVASNYEVMLATHSNESAALNNFGNV
jgi:hypothetical protein